MRDEDVARPLLLGAVLAGGAARRFGGDKTAAEVAGVPMVRRAVEALAEACEEVIVVSARDDTLEGPWRVVPDLRPGLGPLGGMEAALADARSLWPDATSAVFVLAADLPLVGSKPVARLAEAYRGADAGTMAVAAKSARGYEPLCAVYDTRCLTIVSRLLDEGQSAARELFRSVPGVTVEVGDEATFLNVNTREDAELAEAALARRRRRRPRQGTGVRASAERQEEP